MEKRPAHIVTRPSVSPEPVHQTALHETDRHQRRRREITRSIMPY